MALVEISYFSQALLRTVPVSVYLPVDRVDFETMDYMMKPGQKFKTLYLLHGLFGSHEDWLTGTRIKRYASEKGIAVVMPSGDNAFYVNTALPNNDYSRFVGEELVRVTRMMFPLSDRREDTFIAGLSMGGYGALRNGLLYHKNFGAIAAYSSAIHLFEEGADNLVGAGDVLGDLEEARQSDKNPAVALQKMLEDGTDIPRIYLACGTEDSLMEANLKFKALLDAKGVAYTWDEQPGGHDWDFWDMEVKKTLDWLELGESDQGLNSGNIRK